MALAGLRKGVRSQLLSLVTMEGANSAGKKPQTKDGAPTREPQTQRLRLGSLAAMGSASAATPGVAQLSGKRAGSLGTSQRAASASQSGKSKPPAKPRFRPNVTSAGRRRGLGIGEEVPLPASGSEEPSAEGRFLDSLLYEIGPRRSALRATIFPLFPLCRVSPTASDGVG